MPTPIPPKNKHIPHYKKAIGLCLLVTALCGLALARDCVTLYEDVFCVENFSHEKLTRAIELIKIEPEKNTSTEMQIQISLSKEKLMRLMLLTEGDIRVEVKQALAKLKNEEIQQILSQLNDDNTDTAHGMYWNLQLAYENDLLMKKMYPFFYKCAHDPKVREAYDTFHNKNRHINEGGAIQANHQPVEEFKTKTIEVIESFSQT